MSDKFYNPYQFIPVRAPKAEHLTDYQDLNALKAVKNTFVRHDYWHEKGKSGRLLCSIKLESPTFVGNLHDTDNYAPQVIEGYKGKIDDKKLYMLPANSLRGMIASVAETLSLSSLRVLEDKNLSVRKDVDESLPALGRLRKIQPKEGCSIYGIQPMTLGTGWEEAKNNYFTIKEKWAAIFKGRTLQKILPVYIDGYVIRNKTEHLYQLDSFLGREQPDSFPSYDQNRNLIFYYAKLHSELAQHKAEGKIPFDTKGLYIKRNKYLIGQRLLSNDRDSIISEKQYQELSEKQKESYTKGLLRVMDVLTHSGNIPTTKKHELFIPYPDDLNNKDGTPTGSKCINLTVEDKFNQLTEDAKDMDKEKKLPVLLKGYKDAKFDQNKLFYFDINDQGSVSEVGLSAIWRASVGNAYKYFQEISPHLLPWHKERSKLTPAEALFGVVQSDKADSDDSRNLASRVRFSDAVPVGIESAEDQIGNPITLKILSSPKLPSPTMYFHPKSGSGGWIQKTKLTPTEHSPNGRKVYLHQHKQHGYGEGFWKTSDEQKNIEQKVNIKPLRTGQTFQFYIDFENLSKAELGLLTASLEPNSDYLHKLGMGKPLGLGSVKVKLDALLFIERSNRYQIANINTPRYAEGWVADGVNITAFAVKQKKRLATYHWDQSLIDSMTRKNIEVAGNPAKLNRTIPINHPAEVGQAEETEGFQWFVNNAHKDGSPPKQALGVISNGRLPSSLEKNKQEKKPKNNW